LVANVPDLDNSDLGELQAPDVVFVFECKDACILGASAGEFQVHCPASSMH
jgi:hypothetical protein